MCGGFLGLQCTDLLAEFVHCTKEHSCTLRALHSLLKCYLDDLSIEREHAHTLQGLSRPSGDVCMYSIPGNCLEVYPTHLGLPARAHTPRQLHSCIQGLIEASHWRTGRLERIHYSNIVPAFKQEKPPPGSVLEPSASPTGRY